MTKCVELLISPENISLAGKSYFCSLSNGYVLLVDSLFYENCRTFWRAHWLTSRQTHEFIIFAMRQQVRADNLTVCYRKKQMDISFLCVCPVIDNEFRYNIVKVVDQ